MKGADAGSAAIAPPRYSGLGDDVFPQAVCG